MENNNEYRYLQVYKGNCFSKKYIKNYQKVIVFDLDETLGSFFDLNLVWTGLNKIRKKTSENEQNEFNYILDLYPEFLRYGILNILDYLYLKKKQNECYKIYIYTNNNCNPPWVSLITKYFNYKLKLKLKDELFDKIISAFKINNKIIQLSRSTYAKTYNDFINCTLLPKTTEICFLDNTYYNEMKSEKVYYIQPKSYIHNLNTKTIIDRFLHSNILSQMETIFDNSVKIEEFLYDWFNANRPFVFTPLQDSKPHLHKNNVSEINIFVAQKMMYHIKEFFYLTNRKNKTRKNKLRLTKTTRKMRII
jgi:hypothetical protein